MEERNVAQMQQWTKEELIVEVALIKVRIKSSRNYRQVQYRRELIATMNTMIAKMEAVETSQEESDLVVENAYLMAKQDNMKKRNINSKTVLRKSW